MNDYKEKAQAILAKLTIELDSASDGNPEELFKIRRYVMKRLEFAERGRPSDRKKLKFSKMVSQRGLCAVCKLELPVRGAELDRIKAIDGYTEANTRLVCYGCHRKQQEDRNFS